MRLEGYPFEIFKDGRIKGPSGKILNPTPNSDGYQIVWYGPRSAVKCIKVHTLVCTAFHGPKPSPDHEVCHLNGNRADNRADNLTWGTREENARDKTLHGTQNLCVLTWEQVDQIRSKYIPQKVTYRMLAEEYGVSVNTITRAVKHQTYRRHRV